MEDAKPQVSVPLSFHVMEYQEWNRSFREPTIQGDAFYIDWFLANSKMQKVSDQLYHDVILGHPVICTGLTNTIINYGYYKSAESRNLLYFQLEAGATLNILKSKIY